MDAQSKAINAIKKEFDKQKEELGSLKKYNEDAEQKLMEQLKFEVFNRLFGAPVAFVFVTYYLYHERSALPEFFYQFPPRLHLKYVDSMKRIAPTSEVTLGALHNIMEGPYGDIIQLIHLWVIRTSLANKQSVAHLVPDSTFALETLHDIIHDASQQALIEKILPSLVEDDGDQIKYFVSS
ncbi:hypothetical protein IW262DRAFT_1477503 [Armillaria fumosa]|nr:hypothetical protein IW262DRAFT_1477503 [Armillaria fumosa]